MTKIQYTIRNIPLQVDRVIKKQSKQSGKSFNQTVVDILALQTLGTTKISDKDDFDWLFGANSLDQGFDEAIKDMSKIDEKIW